MCLVLVTSRGIAVTNKYKRSCRRLERNNGWFNLVWSTYSEQRVLDFFLIGLFLFPAIATNFFPKTGLAVPNTSSRAHLSVFSSSSNVEHLLQIGIEHFKQVYFVFEKQELHISSLVTLALHAAISVDKYAPQRMFFELNCLQNTL